MAWASAGARHTLCIDSEGRLFYFGSKEAVGIPGKDSQMQFYPVRLLPKDQERQAQAARGFVYCSASSGKNLVIAAADRSMFEFGRDQLEHVYQKRQRQLQ